MRLVTVRSCPTTTVPRSKAFASVRAMSKAPLLLRLTAPVKSLPALSKVIALAPVLMFAVESASIAPVCVIAPPLVRVKAPVAVIPAIEVAVVSAKVTADPVKVTAPVKSFNPPPLKSIV